MDVLIGLRNCVDSLIINSGSISDVQLGNINKAYKLILMVQREVSCYSGPVATPNLMCNLSDRLMMAVEAILDYYSRGDGGFCLNCNKYTKDLSASELEVLFDYFIKNGYAGSTISDFNLAGKRLFFLRKGDRKNGI